MNKEVSNVSRGVSFLKNLAGTVAGVSILGFGVREIIQLADSMTLLRSRIDVFVGAGDKATTTLRNLISLATDTKSSLTDIAEVFSRIVTATNRLNLSVDAQLGLTRVLQQSFRLSGSSATEATGATIQFAQALSFGQLRGQELRSVLSQNSVLATIFSKAIEKSGKDIYKFAEAGGFTTKFVLKALADNFKDINTKADKMSQTFGQTLSLAMNKITVAVDDLNKKFGLNEGFASFMDFIFTNGDKIVATLLAIGAVALPSIAASLGALFTKLEAAVGAISAPVLIFNGLLVALAGAAIYASGGLKQFIGELITFIPAFEAALIDIAKIGVDILFFGNRLAGVSDPITDLLNKRLESIRQFNAKIRAEYAPAKQFVGPPRDPIAEQLAALEEAARKVKANGTVKTVKELIGELNTQFNKGAIGLEDYNRKLKILEMKELTEELQKGKISIEKFNEEVRKNDLEAYARLLDGAKISVEQFNQKADAFRLEQLNEKFRKGKITAAEFYSQLAKFQDTGLLDGATYKVGIQAGVKSFIEGIGTASEMIADLTKNTFRSMEDAITDSLKGSTDAFQKFTDTVLEELTRIAIRMTIIKPLAQGFGNFLDGFFAAGSTPTPSPAGAGSTLYQSPIPYASGGVVDSPMYFSHNSGKLGVMGEAGPEAVLPLKRDSSGALGVSASGGGGGAVTVNIINNNGSQVSTKEGTDSNGNKTIEVLVESAVNKGFSNGRFDRVMKNNFGIDRKGG